jgi:hypothetical protein
MVMQIVTGRVSCGPPPARRFLAKRLVCRESMSHATGPGGPSRKPAAQGQDVTILTLLRPETIRDAENSPDLGRAGPARFDTLHGALPAADHAQVDCQSLDLRGVAPR